MQGTLIIRYRIYLVFLDHLFFGIVHKYQESGTVETEHVVDVLEYLSKGKIVIRCNLLVDTALHFYININNESIIEVNVLGEHYRYLFYFPHIVQLDSSWQRTHGLAFTAVEVGVIYRRNQYWAGE